VFSISHWVSALDAVFSISIICRFGGCVQHLELGVKCGFSGCAGLCVDRCVQHLVFGRTVGGCFQYFVLLVCVGDCSLWYLVLVCVCVCGGVRVCVRGCV
jgi:hypothetical protein